MIAVIKVDITKVSVNAIVTAANSFRLVALVLRIALLPF